MNRAVRIACAVLFVGTTACSLFFSASATMAKAASVNVPPSVVWSAVGFLELLSLAGTLRWVTASTARGRWHAIVVVTLAALVTAQAGWTFYGWWGALAPLAVVATLHMVDETLRDSGQPETAAPEQDDQDDHVPWGGPPEVEVAPTPPRRTVNPAPRLRAVHDDGLEGLSRDQLREVARAEGVPVRGSRAEVAERVRAARAAVTTPVTEDVTSEEVS